jgi:hypothetical protein
MEDNIKIDLIKLECGGMEKINLAQYKVCWQAVVNSVMSPRIPL